LIDGPDWLKRIIVKQKDRLLDGLVPPRLMASLDPGYSDPGGPHQVNINNVWRKGLTYCLIHGLATGL